MTTPQSGIFTEGSRSLHVLEYTLKSDVPDSDLKLALKHARASIPNGVAHVVALGPTAWTRLAPGPVPNGFSGFQPLNGPSAHAPATQHDIFVWLHGPTRDDILDAVFAADHALRNVAARVLDLPGFVYHDSRDLTGFVDGSANPKDIPARQEAALVPEGLPGAGGTFILSQRWVHDLDAFNQLSQTEQERVIGRTKPDSIELEGDAQPADSHVSRTDLKVGNVAQKMYRRSFPYGTAGEHGLYFLAFACEQTRFANVLESMFGRTADGVSDHLLQFTTAVTGSYWFAPSEEDLNAALG